MCRSIAFALMLLVVCSQVFAQSSKSDYAGQEHRKIKSLSEQEIRGLLEGHGMGFAKAAELNGYPGPKHVLELAEQLSLDEAQIAASKQIYDEMHQSATQLGTQYVDLEGKLDRLFAETTIDEKQLNALVDEIGAVQAKIRFAHMNAHLKMKAMLSQHQVAKYVELRGYTNDNMHKTMQH